MSIKDLQKYKCDECGKHFILNIGLKGHITAVHEKRFNCDQCGKNLAREFNLKVLTQIFHEKDFEFNCVHCGENFTTAFINNQNHWIEITNYNFLPFSILLLGRRFYSRQI